MINSSTATVSKDTIEKAIMAGMGFYQLAETIGTTEYVIQKYTLLYWGTKRPSELRKTLGAPEAHRGWPGAVYPTCPCPDV